MTGRNNSDGEKSVYESCTEDMEISELHKIFRKHFEAEFEPLPEARPVAITLTEEEEPEDDDGDASAAVWEGLSDEDKPVAELVQYNTSQTTMPEMTSEEYRTFMTSKPPRSTKTSPPTGRKPPQDDPEAPTDAANLRKDLELQRLLRESHLLSSSGPASNLSHTGVNRHRALDMRLQHLGSKNSIFTQEKMPLAQRKGIVAKAKAQEENRRREAFVNGIVLEKAKAQKRNNASRERAIGAPAVGRFRGGTLKLTRKDVAEIEGPRKKVMGGKGGKRKRR